MLNIKVVLEIDSDARLPTGIISFLTTLRLTAHDITARPRRDYGSPLTRLRLTLDEVTARRFGAVPSMRKTVLGI